MKVYIRFDVNSLNPRAKSDSLEMHAMMTSPEQTHCPAQRRGWTPDATKMRVHELVVGDLSSHDHEP